MRTKYQTVPNLFRQAINFSCLALAILLPMLSGVVLDLVFWAEEVREETSRADQLLENFRRNFLLCIMAFSFLAIFLPLLAYVMMQKEK